jgi:hypothetical protein
MRSGPHFSYTYYISVTGVVGSIASLLSVMVYQSVLSNWKFRPAIALTVVMGTFASMIDLLIIKRWNTTYLGIPDKVFFMFGNAIVANILTPLRYIPMNTIAAKMTPPGMESAVFGTLMDVYHIPCKICVLNKHTLSFLFLLIGLTFQHTSRALPWSVLM